MIFVTGAGGNVGRAVLDACHQRSLPAVGGERRAGAHRRFDFEDRDTWAPALEGCTQLFLLRPPPISKVAETLNPFVDFARTRGVRHVVFLSVQGAESRPRIPHHAVEKHLEHTGDDWTFLRPGFFAQNFTDAYRSDIIEDDRVYVPAGDGEVAFVDVRDLGLVAARVFQDPAPHRRQGYRLTGPRCFTFQQAAAVLTEVTGRPIRYVPASMAGYAWHLVARRRLALMQAVIQTYLHVGLRHGDAALVDPLLEQLLGKPSRDLAHFLHDSPQAWKRT
ncbi:MAG: NmrA family NAD(P)-binding protein [Archangium sp.]|nr:NmrA family NAD(P)-binding protein [Archangium sp.]